jgi:hypothetical protein
MFSLWYGGQNACQVQELLFDLAGTLLLWRGLRIVLPMMDLA